MTTPAIIVDPQAALDYIQGCHAPFTLVSKRTGARFTYRSRRGEHAILLDALFGPDNERNYHYVGHWTPGRLPQLKSFGLATVALNWTIAALLLGRMHTELEFWHSGRCGRCGRLLTTPESIKRGLGPVCAEKK